MSIAKQIQDMTHMAFISSMQVRERCHVCKKAFDRLSSDWIYRIRIGNSTKYMCSYTCWRATDKKKSTVLRGEKLAQDRIQSGKERDDL